MVQAFSEMTSNPLSQHPQAIERASQIKLLVLDVDGVLTDGSLFISDNGHEVLKVFDSLDGHGIKLLLSVGIQIAIITGRNSTMVSNRAKELGITHTYMAVKNKWDTLSTLIQELKIPLHLVAAVGDDWPDLTILPKVGFAACPAQAHDEVKKRVHYISSRSGGMGAVREICDLILKSQNHYERLLKEAL